MGRRSARVQWTTASGNRRAPLEALAQTAEKRARCGRSEIAISAALPRPTIAGTFSVEAPPALLRPPTSSRRARCRCAPRAPPRQRTVELVAAERQIVDPELLDRDRDLAHRLHRVAEHRNAALTAAAETSATGWMVPSSLFASIRQTSSVSGAAPPRRRRR
jgi:hypothetical protein